MDVIKYIIDVEQKVNTNRIDTTALYDNTIKKYRSPDYIKRNNVNFFFSMDDMKESIRRNLNGNAKIKSWGFDSDVMKGVVLVFE